ncbi:Hypothetical protein UVM_LOCUS222 [uncultured virus]|nr:Hypothetical protein UVM_LOCUS222 [uncultured virus]
MQQQNDAPRTRPDRTLFPDCELVSECYGNPLLSEGGSHSPAEVHRLLCQVHRLLCHRERLAVFPYFRCLFSKTPPLRVHQDDGGVQLWGCYPVRLPFAWSTLLLLVNSLYGDPVNVQPSDAGELLAACTFLGMETERMGVHVRAILGCMMHFNDDGEDDDRVDLAAVRQFLKSIHSVVIDATLETAIFNRMLGYLRQDDPLLGHILAKRPDLKTTYWRSSMCVVGESELVLGGAAGVTHNVKMRWQDLAFACGSTYSDGFGTDCWIVGWPYGENLRMLSDAAGAPRRRARVTLTVYDPVEGTTELNAKSHDRGGEPLDDEAADEQRGILRFPTRILGDDWMQVRRAHYSARDRRRREDPNLLAYQFRVTFLRDDDSDDPEPPPCNNSP